jgi:acetylornithine aminotransferase
VARAAELGQRLLKGFENELGDLAAVRAIRGRGLMLGIELDRPCPELVKQALEQGLLINVTAERVVRLLPPLILSDDQADTIVAQVSQLIRNLVAD